VRFASAEDGIPLANGRLHEVRHLIPEDQKKIQDRLKPIDRKYK